MAKTTKKTTKPVTMAERVKRIELDVNRHGANMAAITAAMREQLTTIAEEAMRASTMAHHARTNSRGNTVILTKIQSDLSLLLSGASFMRELEKAKPTDEQGLEPGDYTDASKEVADELTAMGWDVDYFASATVAVYWRGAREKFICHDLDRNLETHKAYYPRPEFVARARVTAKRLGLVPVEAKKWKPKIGQWIKPVDGKWQARVYDGVIAKVKSGPDEHGHYLSDGPEFYFTVDEVRPATPEEVAKYHADQEAAAEAAKPIVFGTRVRKIRDETEWRVACSAPHADGRWLIVNEENFWSEGRKRHEFKVIDP